MFEISAIVQMEQNSYHELCHIIVLVNKGMETSLSLLAFLWDQAKLHALVTKTEH